MKLFRALIKIPFILILVASAAFQADVKVLTEADLDYIYFRAAWEPYPNHGRKCIYMGENFDSVKVYNGHFIGGIKGLLNYTNLHSSISSFLTVKRGMNKDSIPHHRYGTATWETMFELLSGMKTLKNEKHAWVPSNFREYNPKFIEWAIRNLIPNTEAKIGYNTTAQDYYNDVYKRFFRLMAESYLYLENNDIESKSLEYELQLNENPNFEALSYLKENYGEVLNEYDDRLDCALNAELCIGFWIRRNLKKQDKLIWRGFDVVLSQYDSEWFAETKSKYGKY